MYESFSLKSIFLFQKQSCLNSHSLWMLEMIRFCVKQWMLTYFFLILISSMMPMKPNPSCRRDRHHDLFHSSCSSLWGHGPGEIPLPQGAVIGLGPDHPLGSLQCFLPGVLEHPSKAVLTTLHIPPGLPLPAPRSLGTRQESADLHHLYTKITFKSSK